MRTKPVSLDIFEREPDVYIFMSLEKMTDDSKSIVSKMLSHVYGQISQE